MSVDVLLPESYPISGQGRLDLGDCAPVETVCDFSVHTGDGQASINVIASRANLS